MGTETERKFLVNRGVWQPQGAGVLMRQGYLSSAKERVVRVRVAAPDAFVTIKGAPDDKLTRLEFEYPIPLQDAAVLLDRLCERPLLEKTRHREKVGTHTWEIDVFHGENEGLVVAEIELADPGESFERPAWIGAEVSDDPRYYNVNLVALPFSRWRSGPADPGPEASG